ncbi:sugar O-acetyltransferase [Levilactobacillus cerevisiae]|uniref:sugar O-acetyltransferase n=1 Tax=Levilactobacillus cerevisiae TaxID=1704076 RepID=UPI000F76659E|nr:sugar O-acetyltransferase [Levilactobacillus cerevisiae]
MTEEEKMLAGKLYDPSDAQLTTRLHLAHRLSQQYNQTFDDETTKREALLDQLIPHHDTGLYLQGPIFFDYGLYTHLGKNFYANANFTVLDCGLVTIGDNCWFGPNVTLVTPMHPLRYQERNLQAHTDGTLFDIEYDKPIAIGDNCWLASNVTVTGGVTIGAGCVIGAGSVVTRDIPANSLAVGNPCRVVREITAADAIALKSEIQ